jgi:hypothetical protein
MSHKTLCLYLDGELSASMAERVRAHLDECPACSLALTELQRVDDAVRRTVPRTDDTPDVAARATEELRRRGSFFRARVAAGKRRLFGRTTVSVRGIGVVLAAAAVVVAATMLTDHAMQQRWANRTAPVLADAERVLVRLVRMDMPGENERLAWARDESRKLGLTARLAEARSDAAPAYARDLAPLEEAFAMLALEAPLPPGVLAKLGEGEYLGRAVRLRESLTASR